MTRAMVILWLLDLAFLHPLTMKVLVYHSSSKSSPFRSPSPTQMSLHPEEGLRGHGPSKIESGLIRTMWWRWKCQSKVSHHGSCNRNSLFLSSWKLGPFSSHLESSFSSSNLKPAAQWSSTLSWLWLHILDAKFWQHCENLAQPCA